MQVLKVLKLNVKYLMQIQSAEIHCIDYTSYSRNRFTFDIRAWPDKTKPEQYVDFRTSFYDGGSAEAYAIEFIETSTNGIYGEISLSEMEGAVFIGKLTMNTKTDNYGNESTYINLVACKHVGFSEIDDFI